MYTCFHNLNGPMGQSIKKQKIPKCSRTYLEAQCTLPLAYNQSEDNLAARIFSSYENYCTTVT
jgi:hypothetical protein